MPRHIHLQRLFVFAVLTIGTSWAHAQKMGELQLSSSKIPLGQSVSLALAIDFSTANNPLCAVEISYGDGTSETVRVEPSKLRNNQLFLQHVYQSSGNYTLRVEGKAMFRGFKTAMACQGAPLERSLTVAAYQSASQQAAKAKPQPKPKAQRNNTHKASTSEPFAAPAKVPDKAATKAPLSPTAKPDAPVKKKPPVIKPF